VPVTALQGTVGAEPHTWSPKDPQQPPRQGLGSAPLSAQSTGLSAPVQGLYIRGVGLLAAVAATGALLSAMFRRSASSAAALPLLAGLKDAPAELRMVSVSGQEDLAHCAVVRELMKAYIEDTVGLGAPTFLGGLLYSLQRSGQSLVTDPKAVRTTHKLNPLLIPLTESPEGWMTCLLRRLRDEDGDDFVVVKTKGGPTSGVEPLARNVTEAVRRACAEADAAGDAEALEQCCDAGLRTPYQSGEDRGIIAKYGLDKYVTLKVGTFPDLCEELIEGHLERGDKTAAMVVCEKMNRDLPNIGWTQVRHALLMDQLNDNRPLEVRDCARVALHQFPTWSMGVETDSTVDRLLELTDGGMPAEPDGSGPMIQTRKELGEYKRLKSKDLQEDKLNQGEITPEQVAYERAGFLLDSMALGAAYDGDWSDEGFRTEMADLCDAAGLAKASKLVRCN